MRIEVRVRVSCQWCEAKAETWALARLSYEGNRIEEIDVAAPEGWTTAPARAYDAWYSFACPAHRQTR